MFKKISSLHRIIFNALKKEHVAYTRKSKVLQKDYTPTYLIVAKDMQSPHKQVFEAAVYYLCEIATLKKEFKSNIVEILSTFIQNNKYKSERTSYIKQMMSEYKLN